MGKAVRTCFTEMQCMWLYKLMQIPCVLLFLSPWKTKSQVIRLAGTFVASLPWHCRPLRWCFIALQRAVDVKNPTVSTVPKTCLAIPCLKCRLVYPIRVFATAFHAITPSCCFIWDSLFHKIIQEQSSYLYISIRTKILSDFLISL